MSRLSVVIPTLDEAEALPDLLDDLRAQTDVSLQIVIADGGSTDGTLAGAQARGVTVVGSARGRGRQMNAGARATHGELLLFLHADSRLPSPTLLARAVALLEEARRGLGSEQVAGHFPLCFQRSAAGSELLFRYLERKTELNRRYTIHGDQGLLIPRSYFEQLGGFDESLPFLEDARLAERIFAGGCWIVLPGRLATAARRFEADGPLRRYTLMALIMGMHAADAREFFARAPGVYAPGATGRIDLRPFARLIREVLRERGAWRTARPVGRFVRENAWQLAFRRDVRLGRGQAPALQFHDRWLAPLTRNALVDTLSAALVLGWFWFGLPRWLRRLDALEPLPPPA